MAPKVRLDWRHCDYTKLTDEELDQLLKPSFALRSLPPVGPNSDETWAPRERVYMTMAWADRKEEENYQNILETWTYDEKIISKIVAGPRRWVPKAKGQKRQITEEMRTWQQYTCGEILVNVKDNIWEPIVLGCPADSMFSSAFFETTNNEESWEAKTTSLYDTLEIDKDSGICSIPLRSEGGPSTALASYDVRNPQYIPQVNLPEDKPLTPGLVPK